MANLFSGVIDTSSAWQTLAELTGITFTEGKTYTIQILNAAYVREGAPDADNNNTGGFYIFDNKPFQYAAGADALYIKTPYQKVSINIAG